MKKVLILLSHAPHYREEFLRQLASQCELTVIAKPCAEANLTPPDSRGNYRYIEEEGGVILRKFGIYYLPAELEIIKNERWDVIYAGWNLRHIARYIGFIISSKTRNKWIWSGMFYGKRNGPVLSFIRRYFISKSNGVVVYSSDIKKKLQAEGVNKEIVPFNNSEVSIKEFNYLPMNFSSSKLNLLFVGRYQERKKLDRLISLGNRNINVNIRLVGPGMEKLEGKVIRNNISIFGPAVNKELEKHMKWAHIVVSPGHLGLLVANAARFGRPIIVDKYSNHAPEVVIAKESKQPFIDWGNPKEVDSSFEWLLNNNHEIEILRKKLFEHTKRNYTVENMVAAYIAAGKVLDK